MLTICHHVDDCKISQVHAAVVDETISLIRGDFEILFEDGSGAMQVHRGKICKYPIFDFTWHENRVISNIKIFDIIWFVSNRYSILHGAKIM